MGKNEVPEETSNTVIHCVACTFTRLSQREKKHFSDVVSTPKRFGDHCKSFPENRKNSNFLEPRILSFIKGNDVGRFVTTKQSERCKMFFVTF